MISVPNFSGIIGFWLLFQIVSSVISSLVMIYVLFCLGKTAAAMERVAAAIEKLAEHQTGAALPPGRSNIGIPSTYAGGGYGAPGASPLPGAGPVSNTPTPVYPSGSPSYAPAPGSAPLPSSAPAPFTPGASPTSAPLTGIAPASGAASAPIEGEFSSGSNVPYIPRHETRP